MEPRFNEVPRDWGNLFVISFVEPTTSLNRGSTVLTGGLKSLYIFELDTYLKNTPIQEQIEN